MYGSTRGPGDPPAPKKVTVPEIRSRKLPGAPPIAMVTAYDYTMARLLGKQATFQVYVENLGDKRTWSAAGGGFLAVGLPRTVRMSMKVDF